MGINRFLCGMTALVTAFFSTQTLAATNLVKNPGFETGNLTDWTTFANFNTGRNGVVSSADGQTPYQGSFFLVLGNDPITEGVAGVSQVLNTVAGQTYSVSLAWSDTAFNFPGDQLFEVLWDGNIVASVLGETGSTNWSILSNNVTGTGTDTLVISGYSSQGHNNIDDVSVVTVPEPSTWAMMLAGFAVLGLAGYRASRKLA